MKIIFVVGLLVWLVEAKRILQSSFPNRWPSAPSTFNPTTYNLTTVACLCYANQLASTPTYAKFRTELQPPGNPGRLGIIENNIKLINHHNSNPLRTYNMKLNEFILMSP